MYVAMPMTYGCSTIHSHTSINDGVNSLFGTKCMLNACISVRFLFTVVN